VIALVIPALITALVVADTFLADDDTPTLDARAAGVLAGLVVLWFRRSPVVALVVAAGLTALVRAVS
jgi:hypothetical protein